MSSYENVPIQFLNKNELLLLSFSSKDLETKMWQEILRTIIVILAS